MKLQVGDEVIVTAGKDKGRRGKIEKIFPQKDRVFSPGLNVYKRHQRSLPGRRGGIIEFSRPLPVSNVALICPNCQKPTRVGMKILKTGEKARICRKCDKQINGGSVSKSK